MRRWTPFLLLAVAALLASACAVERIQLGDLTRDGGNEAECEDAEGTMETGGPGSDGRVDGGNSAGTSDTGVVADGRDPDGPLATGGPDAGDAGALANADAAARDATGLDAANEADDAEIDGDADDESGKGRDGS
jgi:hypothetical protein